MSNLTHIIPSSGSVKDSGLINQWLGEFIAQRFPQLTLTPSEGGYWQIDCGDEDGPALSVELRSNYRADEDASEQVAISLDHRYGYPIVYWIEHELALWLYARLEAQGVGWVDLQNDGGFGKADWDFTSYPKYLAFLSRGPVEGATWIPRQLEEEGETLPSSFANHLK